MKELKLISVFCFFSLVTIAQEWAPVGATWHYTERFFMGFTPLEIDYIKIESVKDTVVDGITCKKLTKRHNVACADRPYVEYMYSQNGKVYFYDAGFSTFQVLYDFSADQGDSWIIKIKNYTNPDDTDSLIVTVDSIDFITINEIELKRLYVTNLFLNEVVPNFTYNATIIESIGDLIYMFNFFPSFAFACDGNYSDGLRCYEDSVIGLWETGIADSCTYIKSWTGVRNNENSRITIYPNPVEEYIYISSEQISPCRYRILEITGREILSGEIASNRIMIQNLPKGLYILELSSSSDTLISRQKILKN